MDRKSFIKNCGVACASGVVLATFLESCASANYYAKTQSRDGKIVIPKEEFLRIEDGVKVKRQFVLVRATNQKYPICVYNAEYPNSNGYMALLMGCTHKGCELHVNGDYLICPCHGSEFTNNGLVQNPPAEKNLQMFVVTSYPNEIVVHT